MLRTEDRCWCHVNEDSLPKEWAELVAGEWQSSSWVQQHWGDVPQEEGGRAHDVLCGHSKENTIPDGRDEMGMLQKPQTKSAREGKKGS